MYSVDINLDLHNFKFPMLFSRKEDFLRNLQIYYPYVPDEYILSNNKERSTFKFHGEWEKTQSYKHTPDSKYINLEYTIDKYGSRASKSIENLSNNDTLVSGCSNTWGHGSFYEETWPYLAYGNNHVNLAINGAPSGYIIKTINATLDFFTPKEISIFFPTLDRVEYMEFNSNEDKHKLYHLSAGVVRTGSKYMQNLYKETLMNISEHMYIMWFLSDFSLLIEKCKNKNILLNVGSWDKKLQFLLEHYSYRGYSTIKNFPKLNEFPAARDPHHKGVEYHQRLADKFKHLR